MSRHQRDRKERFDEKWTSDVSGCWLWTAGLDKDGYGTFSIRLENRDRSRRAHRISYELYVGPIPDGLVIDHLCCIRNCVNPKHLEPVTVQENTLRGTSAAGLVARLGVCCRGHDMLGDNVYVSPGGERQCRECKRIRGREYDKSDRRRHRDRKRTL